MYAFQIGLETAARQMFSKVVNGEDSNQEFPGLNDADREAHVERLLEGLTLADAQELGLVGR